MPLALSAAKHATGVKQRKARIFLGMVMIVRELDWPRKDDSFIVIYN